MFKSTTTKIAKNTQPKAASTGKNAVAKTTAAETIHNKLLEHGKQLSTRQKLLSKPGALHTHITSSRTVPPTPHKALTVKPAAALGLDQKPKDGSTIGSIDPAIHTVEPDILYPGDTQLLRLPWGGVLSYARLGRKKEVGEVWVDMHGTPGSRLAVGGTHKYCESKLIRLITIDRPGYGHSTLEHGRGMSDFIKDVEYLLDFLGVKQFKMVGTSGGGPYVLAAVHHFPKDRLIKSLIMCGMTHPDYDKASLPIHIKIKQKLARYGYHHFMGYNPKAALYFDLEKAKGDQNQIKKIQAQWGESHRQGTAGYRSDHKLFSQPWEFDLKDINANPMRWYHGALDVNTSSSAARATVDHANRLRKNIEYIEVPGLDHYELQHEQTVVAYDWLLKKKS